MPIFEIEHGGKTFEVEAPDLDSAASGFESFLSEQKTQAPPAAEPPRQEIKQHSRGLSRGGLVPGVEGYKEKVQEVQDTAKAGALGLSQGATFGIGDEIYGAAVGAGNFLTGNGFSEPYAKARDENRDANKWAEETRPGIFNAGKVLGGVATTMPLAATATGAKALGMVGGNLLTRSAASGASGAIIGGAQGFAEGEGGVGERLAGAGQGAKWGGGVGALSPAAALLLGMGVRRVLGAVPEAAGQNNALTSLSPGARRYVEEISTPDKVARIEQGLQRLGPDGMLADVSPEWRMVARGAAARPGTRDTVVDALINRDQGKNVRLGSDLDRTLGPAPVPSQVEAGLEAGREALGPDYGVVFRGASAVDTRQLADVLETGIVNTRGRAQEAMRSVRRMLDIPGSAGNLDPNPQSLLSTRQAIDGMLKTEADPNAIRALTTARQQVDGELTRAVPGIKNVDAQYAELARQSEGVRRGSQVFDGGKTAIRPQELGLEIAEAANPQGTLVGPSAVPHRVRQGARAEIDRVVGTNANDPVALDRLVKGEGDWNRDKARQVFGQERADEALGAIDREVRFRDTTNKVTAGSDTAPTEGFKDFLDRAERPRAGNGVNGETLTGLALTGAKKLTSVITNQMGKAKAERFATELAQVAIAQGMGRDEFVAALKQAGIQQRYIKSAVHHATATGLISGSAARNIGPTPEKR